jgi:hypothetical protein
MNSLQYIIVNLPTQTVELPQVEKDMTVLKLAVNIMSGLSRFSKVMGIRNMISTPHLKKKAQRLPTSPSSHWACSLPIGLIPMELNRDYSLLDSKWSPGLQQLPSAPRITSRC